MVMMGEPNHHGSYVKPGSNVRSWVACYIGLWKPIYMVVVYSWVPVYSRVPCNKSFFKLWWGPSMWTAGPNLSQMATASLNCIVLWERLYLLLSAYFFHSLRQRGKEGTGWISFWLWGFCWYQPLISSCLWVVCVFSKCQDGSPQAAER